MPRNTYIGQIKDGKLYISGPRRAQMLSDMSKLKEGKLVELEIRVLPHRSNPQNAYYWGVVVAMVKEALQDLGHDVDATLTHELLKSKFNGKTLCNNDGEVIGEIGDTTTKMTKSEFMDYLANIQKWAATYLSLTIPDPETQSTITFKD